MAKAEYINKQIVVLEIENMIKETQEDTPDTSHWEFPDKKFGPYEYSCSKCGKTFEASYKGTRRMVIEEYKFCPNCGSKIDAIRSAIIISLRELQNSIYELPVSKVDVDNGVWEEYDCDTNWTCNRCGDVVCEVDSDKVLKEYPYCPNCGCKMVSVEIEE